MNEISSESETSAESSDLSAEEPESTESKTLVVYYSATPQREVPKRLLDILQMPQEQTCLNWNL